MSKQAKEVLEVDKLEAVADRGYFDGEEILACKRGRRCSHLAQAHDVERQGGGPVGKQDFAYLADADATAAHPASCCPISTPTSSME
ncbi:hypothetical protein IVA92_26775 [Bradyrhizobium sp. 154]|nr:hypothetical protein [Bradyrhizobium sp. 154]